MATIEEDYVSFEIAKLLKEKGLDKDFDADIVKWYNVNGEDENLCSRVNNKIYKCPSLAMAMKWLREVHNLWCEISPEGKGLWYREVYSLTDEEYIPNSNGHKIKSYEDACEAAIKYSLENLI